MRRTYPLLALLCALVALPAHATVFAVIRGVIHDPQHRPVAAAHILLVESGSALSLSTESDSDGSFSFPRVPFGVYHLEIHAEGFDNFGQTVAVASATNPIAHIALTVAGGSTSVTVNGFDNATFASDSVTPTTLITRSDIDETPGASRALGMQMVTDYVPGAYMSHDMLHIEGGHQASWLIDGVSIPNTKIASNLGPQIDPMDIDSLEVQRGSYGADIGDRTYGAFNVLPRNGFERNHQAELRLIGGNLYSGEAELSLGDHSATTAWYASAMGSRSNYGLATPTPAIRHDRTNSQSSFFSLIRNQDAEDQWRIHAQYRQDFFDLPYDPDPNDWEQISPYYRSFGLRDAQKERDAFLIANWVHTFPNTAVLSVAPFYHTNQANYDSSPTDLPAATTWHQSSTYAGAQADLHAILRGNDLSAGLYSFYQRENDLFGVLINDGSAPSEANSPSAAEAGLAEFYLSDHIRLGSLTLLAGDRVSVYRAVLAESASSPRVGATWQIPRLHWVLRGFYGHFFQPAPIQTLSPAVLNYASHLPAGQNTFTPLPSERDEEHQFGIGIPYRGWMLDIANVRNRVRNFLDHSNLGESNMYFPIAVDGALVRSWELTLRSPLLARVAQFHLAYSNQIAEQRGRIVGGFTCGLPSDPACNPATFSYAPVDHDQRHTLNTGFNTRLPIHSWFATNVYYGSGFVNGLAASGVGPWQAPYLPVHTTFDTSAGHTFGERLKLTATVTNVTNRRVLLDNSITVGGFHWNDPRTFTAELRYKFKF